MADYIKAFASYLELERNASGNTIASYVLATRRSVKDGDTVDGIADNGNLDQSIQWKCHYEDALVQPSRPVLDVHMGQYAAGGR